MNFLNALSPLQWAIAGAIPLGVIALYFLKLKRKPLQIPSTYLWQKSVEDLHVNSLFQRLRRNLLLFLQLLVLALALLAMARPAWKGTEAGGERHVIVIDNSASMSATDVEPSRLEWAKAQARSQVIDRMSGDDLAMIVAFNDSASVVASYTSNRQVLRDRLASIQPTQRTTNLREALEVAAGLANPQKFVEGVRDTSAGVQGANAPQLHLFTDGGFADVPDFSLGNLEPHFYVVGKSNRNAAIVAMMVRRNEESPDKLQVFARLRNFADEPLDPRTELYLDGDLKDAKEVRLEPKNEQAVAFDLANLEQGVLELRLGVKDILASDNIARCVVGTVRRGKVLAVTRGNRYLEYVLCTEATRQVAEINVVKPEDLENADYKQKAASGHYDLIIYDSCVPPAMPQANTLFLGAIPKVPTLGETKKLVDPIIVEVNDANPLFRFVNMENAVIRESLLPELPPGTEVLLESGEGALAFLLTREGYSDCVIGFGFERDGEKGRELNTDWFLKASFPLFVFNALRVLGNVQDAISDEPILPGQTITLRSESLAKDKTIRDPTGASHDISRSPQGTFVFNRTDLLGVYEFGDTKNNVERRFAVNLFDPRESDVTPRSELQIGHSPVAGQPTVNRTQKEAWRWLVLAAFLVLLVEWYIYNRRVYI
ncbi:MAG: BatA domain-containing protein [Planctomycetes bacterium]|nr:BatA domain-containing protein [Planctomycetota bacterium]